MMKYVSKDARRVTLLRHKLQAAEVWADRRKLSAQARLKIRAFYADVWMGHAGTHPRKLLAQHLLSNTLCLQTPPASLVKHTLSVELEWAEGPGPPPIAAAIWVEESSKAWNVVVRQPNLCASIRPQP